MLGAIQAMCGRIKRKGAALARPAREGDVSKRLGLLDDMQARLVKLLSENPKYPRRDMLIRLFEAEMLEARRHYQSRRYRLARKCRGSAMATLICLERNIEAARRDHSVRFISN